ncbi:butyrophilin subfamily 3 member A2-like isoform X3 [Anas acuta]|uniref:butyrophilin subfamily 3 member A2-like isoform X3 n=1 Tax=Anas acuta TaxID=28680 RepID=UPI0035C89405
MGLPWGCGIPSLTGHAKGLLTSLVTLLLLQLGSAQLRVVGPDYPLTATVGQDVVLRCYLSPQRDARSLEVRWIRDEFSETVHHYRNGEDLYGEQMGAYAGRTELLRDGLSAGSLDLRITGLRPSDDGQYICIVKDADVYDKATVDLEMSATGADPHLSLGGYEAGGVRVLCRSAGWYPLPQLLWRDARGQHLPSVSQTHSQDQEGLFEIEGAVIVTGSVEGPLSCMVRSSRLQQERESSLHIAAPFFINAQPLIVVLVLVLVFLAVSIGLGVYLFRMQGKLAAQGWSGGRPASMAAAWGWWQGAAPLHMFPPSNQAALLTTSSSTFAFQWQRGESWVNPCSPCSQPLGKWCLCGRAWSGWALGACVLVARGCWRSSWSLGWEWGVLGLVLPWARDTARTAERNGNQGGDGVQAAGLLRSALTVLDRGILHPSPFTSPCVLVARCRELHKCLSLLLHVSKLGPCSLLVLSF